MVNGMRSYFVFVHFSFSKALKLQDMKFQVHCCWELLLVEEHSVQLPQLLIKKGILFPEQRVLKYSISFDEKCYGGRIFAEALKVHGVK